MSLSFYELGTPPPRVDDITMDALSDRNRRGQIEFFTILGRLIGQPWIRWGAIGIITCADAQRERYVWHYGSHADPAVEAFIAEVESKPGDYLLIGNLAAYQFRMGLVPNCIVLAKETLEDCADAVCGVWHDGDLLRRFIGSELPEFKKLSEQWDRYVNRVKDVTRQHEDAIVYVPVIAQRRRGGREETILAGGLIWCVAPENVGTALKHVAEAQLYLRWHLAELFGRNSLLGLASDFIDIDHVIKDQGWFRGKKFDDGSTNVPHNWTDFTRSPRAQRTGSAELIRLAHSDLERVLDCEIPTFDEITHKALKQLYSGTVSFSSLYLIGTIARQRAQGQKMVIEQSKLKCQDPLPIRAIVGPKAISQHVRSNFFQFINATAVSSKTSNPMLESIDVSACGLTVTYNDPALAKALTNRLVEIFSEAEKHDAPHDSSGPLAEFILWSGSDFNASGRCMFQHQNRYLCVLLRTENDSEGVEKSVLLIRERHT